MLDNSDTEYYRLCQNIHEIEDELKKIEYAKNSYLQFIAVETMNNKSEQ